MKSRVITKVSIVHHQRDAKSKEQSVSCWDLSVKTNVMVPLQIKSEDHQSLYKTLARDRECRQNLSNNYRDISVWNKVLRQDSDRASSPSLFDVLNPFNSWIQWKITGWKWLSPIVSALQNWISGFTQSHFTLHSDALPSTDRPFLTITESHHVPGL